MSITVVRTSDETTRKARFTIGTSDDQKEGADVKTNAQVVLINTVLPSDRVVKVLLRDSLTSAEKPKVYKIALNFSKEREKQAILSLNKV